MLFLLLQFCVASGLHSAHRGAGVATRRGRQASRNIEHRACALPLDEIASKWFLAAKNGLEFRSRNSSWVDERFEVVVSREGGLGLELDELFQQSDGRGIVLVSGVVAGSNAERALGANGERVARGDTIVGVNGDTSIEGLNFDGTVGVLGSLAGDEVRLSLQRLVPRATVQVEVVNTDGSPRLEFAMPSGASLRQALLFNGVRDRELYDAETQRFDAVGNSGSNCGGEKTCGTCLVSIIEGASLASAPGRVEKAALQKQRRPTRWRWSCGLFVGNGNEGGTFKIALRPQSQFADERTK